MVIVSSQDAAQELVNWINAGSVVDPLSSTIRGTDSFAFTELRKTSGKFPKVHVVPLIKSSDDYSFGYPIKKTSTITLLVFFYTQYSKENIYLTYKNESLVSYWLENVLTSAVLGSPNTFPTLSMPRIGEFSGAENDPDNTALVRGAIPISFRVREVPE